MSSQPHHARQMGHNETSYMTLPNTATTDEMSEKTVEMDIIAHLGSSNMGLPERDLIESSPYPTKQRQLSSNYGPSYMAPTQSTKAKVRSQGTVKQRGTYGPQWNPSTRKGLVVESGCDSSSSSGGTTYHAPRSPSPRHNGARLNSRWASSHSPSNGVDDWPLGGPLWRHDFG
jgi:hypothetical protein